MAAVLRSETTTSTSTDAPAPVLDRQQWWEGVQFGVSAMLTEAAHPATSHRLAS